jgi:hypothetical protein
VCVTLAKQLNCVDLVDSSTFSESVKSNRVWWTPDDDQLPDADETPFDVDIADNAVAKKYKVADVTRRADYFVIKSAKDASGKDFSIKVRAARVRDFAHDARMCTARRLTLTWRARLGSRSRRWPPRWRCSNCVAPTAPRCAAASRRVRARRRSVSCSSVSAARRSTCS